MRLTKTTDNGEETIMWLGGSVSPQILLDLFGVEDWEELGPAVVRWLANE